MSGHDAEERAARHLARRGWRILARNWRGGGGELDIVALRWGVVAFVEVKARADPAALADPLRAAQRERLLRAASAYRARHARLANLDTRFDVILVGTERRSGVTHLRGAFQVPDAIASSGSKSRSSA